MIVRLGKILCIVFCYVLKYKIQYLKMLYKMVYVDMKGSKYYGEEKVQKMYYQKLIYVDEFYYMYVNCYILIVY